MPKKGGRKPTVNWKGSVCVDKNTYKGLEIHLSGKFRGMGLERGDSKAYYYLGDPHTSGTYTSNTSKFYKQALKTLADQWNKLQSAPTGKIALGGQVIAEYRGNSKDTLNA